MALLAEEVVEEWLRRSGFFTIRGIKLGVHEIDLLAVRHRPGEEPECRHLEVQASVRPVSYISRVPKALQKQGRAANSAKRSQDELTTGVAEWVNTKFDRLDKQTMRARLWPGKWSRELVLNNVKAAHEVDMIRMHGILVLSLAEIAKQLRVPGVPIPCASGGDFVDLINLGASEA